MYEVMVNAKQSGITDFRKTQPQPNRKIIMQISRLYFIVIVVAAYILPPMGVMAQGYQNGNRLALDYVRADENGRTHLQETRVGAVHTFRYLKIIEIEKDQPEEPRRVNIVAVEPSSDMEIQMIVTRSQRKSMEMAATLNIGDHIAADGRLADLATTTGNRMLLQPVRLNYKDRASPKHGPELLREVDPNAH